MKVCAFQPKYPYKAEETDEYSQFLLDTLDQCDDSLDLIVLPECCNAPSGYSGSEEFLYYVNKNTGPLLAKVKETAIRCKAMVSVNLYVLCEETGRYRNTTMFYGRDGELLGRYLKQHLPVTELKEKMVDDSYITDYMPPTVIEAEGVRFGFLTCYDYYYNEYIAHMVTQDLDVVLAPAHQRGERNDMLVTEAKNIAFNCNAWVVRSSISMGDADYEFGANTMVVAPDGRVIDNIGQKVGVLICEIDPSFKHTRRAGYAGVMVPNQQFIEQGRTPWAYRAGGACVIPGDSALPYPRVCSHRGFNTLMPENTMPAFGLAVAMGADEIELDVWPTKDHKLVVCHDRSVDRTSDGHGNIYELTWDEIKTMNVGGKHSPELDGMGFPLLEDVLAAFPRQTIINLHIKSVGKVEEYDHDDFRQIVDLIHRYDCQEHVYIAGEEDVLRTASKLAPELPRCALDGKLDYTLVDLALKYGCKKLQLFRGYYNQEMIDRANANGIRCNVFWSDDPAEAVELIKRGVSTILTNDFWRVNATVKAMK